MGLVADKLAMLNTVHLRSTPVIRARGASDQPAQTRRAVGTGVGGAAGATLMVTAIAMEFGLASAVRSPAGLLVSGIAMFLGALGGARVGRWVARGFEFDAPTKAGVAGGLAGFAAMCLVGPLTTFSAGLNLAALGLVVLAGSTIGRRLARALA